MKKHFCAALVFAILISCIYIPASAMENMTYEKDMTIARATGRFSMDVSANTIRKASSSFPLEVGEVVTIKASYSPFSANVDFGLIAPNGRFYYIIKIIPPEALIFQGFPGAVLQICYSSTLKS